MAGYRLRVVEHERSAPAFLIQAEPWIAFRPALDAMLGPLGDAAMARAAPRPGDRALDVGCGCGTTTADLALLVGPTGAVTGIDTSAVVLAEARRTIDADTAGGRAPVTLVRGDAATHPFEPEAYDVVYSRLGLMFFDEPDAGFANLRRAMRRRGRLGFVCWRALDENPWITEVRAAATAVVPLPRLAPDDVPGPFALADAERISALLSRAGFVDVEIDPHDQPVLIGRGDVDEAVEFFLRLLPTGSLMFEPDRHLLDRLRAAVRVVVERHRAPDGIWMDAAAWIVRAR
jgi:SAM-dependent methyltransferase